MMPLDQAAWIEPHEPVIPPPGERPVYRLRHEFTLEPATTATAWATAHGIYELFLNGTRVGDEELTPGFTAYRRRLQVHGPIRSTWHIDEARFHLTVDVPPGPQAEIHLPDGRVLQAPPGHHETASPY